jgi:restriction endonuclease S subunit
VTVLRAVQRAKEACEQVIAAARALKNNLLHHLFSYGPIRFDEPYPVPLKETAYGAISEAWPVWRLSECGSVQTGVAKGRRLDGHDTIELPYLRVANVQDGRLDLTEMKSIALRRMEVDRFLLRPGDVVLTQWHREGLELSCIDACQVCRLVRPPLPDQQAVASYLSAIDTKLLSEKARRVALDQLFQSLLHHLMTGKVRVDHLVGQLDPEATA